MQSFPSKGKTHGHAFNEGWRGSGQEKEKWQEWQRIPSAGSLASGEAASRLLIINTTSFYFYDSSRRIHMLNNHPLWPYHVPSMGLTNNCMVIKCSVLYQKAFSTQRRLRNEASWRCLEMLADTGCKGHSKGDMIYSCSSRGLNCVPHKIGSSLHS